MLIPESKRTEVGVDHLMPYLNPDYWDGYALGQDRFMPGKDGRITRGRQRKIAQRALIDYVDQPGGRLSLDTYEEGRYFDPSAHNPGTVVAFLNEILINKGADLPDLPDNLRFPEVNDLMSDTKDLALPNVDISDKEVGARLTYHRVALWGVVTHSRRGDQNNLSYVRPGFIDRSYGRTAIRAPMLTHEEPITIGEVMYSNIPGHECLKRVRRLEVCKYGQPQKESLWPSIFDL